MARLDIRLSDEEKDGLVALARAEGVSLSELVRSRLLERASSRDELFANQGALRDAVNDLEERLSRLEGMAGL